MASNTQNTLDNLFSNLLGGQGLDLSGLLQTLEGGGGTATSSTSAGGGAGSIVSTVLESALGVVPLVSGLLGLFGGGGSSTPPPLVKYSLPQAISFDAADTSTGLSPADYDQSGIPRAYTPQPAAGTNQTTQATTASAQQVTVNVQAMDARSFMDRSSDIAAAVRDAMLNLSTINDVVNDL
jgi:hypothetical protein